MFNLGFNISINNCLNNNLTNAEFNKLLCYIDEKIVILNNIDFKKSY